MSSMTDNLMPSKPPPEIRVVVRLSIDAVVAHSGKNDYFCTYSLKMGPDWTLHTFDGTILPTSVSGHDFEESPLWGQTQVASKGSQSCPIWHLNHPVELVFSSTNPFGWPRLVVLLHDTRGASDLAASAPVGYGTAVIPPSGKATMKVSLYSPTALTPGQGLLASLRGHHIRFFNPTFPACASGHETVRAKSAPKGESVQITCDVVTNLKEHKYCVFGGGGSAGRIV